MNSFGRIFKISIYGESHGKEIGVVIDNPIPGIKLSEDDFLDDLSRRKSSKKYNTPRIEEDIISIDSGVFNGYTTGKPIKLSFKNNNTNSKDYSKFVDHPRPSTSDYVSSNKYNMFNDYRGSGQSSGRLSLLLVAAGVVAKKVIKDITITSNISEALGIELSNEEELDSLIENNPDKTIGGIIKLTINNCTYFLGEPFFDSFESVISHILYSVPSVKGVSFGLGFEGTKLDGLHHNDIILNKDGITKTNNNGGINAGISNNNPIVINVAIKPISSINNQETYNFKSNKIEELDINGRHDTTILNRVKVVLENAVAIAIADLYLIQKLRSDK